MMSEVKAELTLDGYRIWVDGLELATDPDIIRHVIDLTKQLAELEAKLEAANTRTRHYITKSDGLTKQLAVMREALVYYRDECSGREPSISTFQRMLDEALAALPPQKGDDDDSH